MNKIKKIISSIGAFIISMISKVYAIEPAYGVDPGPREKISSIVSTIADIGKITIPIILFVIGFFVVLNKKITKKIKVIVVSVLAILAIIGVVLMNYLATTT